MPPAPSLYAPTTAISPLTATLMPNWSPASASEAMSFFSSLSDAAPLLLGTSSPTANATATRIVSFFMASPPQRDEPRKPTKRSFAAGQNALRGKSLGLIAPPPMSTNRHRAGHVDYESIISPTSIGWAVRAAWASRGSAESLSAFGG